MRHPEEFLEFSNSIDDTVFLNFVQNFLAQTTINGEIARKTMARLRKTEKILSESRKELIFTYKKNFENCKK
jgi:hypothetical protein